MRFLLTAAAATLVASSAGAVTALQAMASSFDVATGAYTQQIAGFDSGKPYRIRFTASGAPRLIVSATGGVAQLYDRGGSTRVGPTPVTYDFIAGGPSQAFQIRDLRVSDLEIDEFAISLIPEPAIWGLMLAGFGIAGAAARRRGRLAVRTA